eukprot:scaffold10537_cov122-Isochrysis_galbana.AAC.11
MRLEHFPDIKGLAGQFKPRVRARATSWVSLFSCSSSPLSSIQCQCLSAVPMLTVCSPRVSLLVWGAAGLFPSDSQATDLPIWAEQKKKIKIKRYSLAATLRDTP